MGLRWGAWRRRRRNFRTFSDIGYQETGFVDALRGFGENKRPAHRERHAKATFAGERRGVSVRRLRLRVRASSNLPLRGWGGSRTSAAQPRAKSGGDLRRRPSFDAADAGEQTSPAYAACGRSGETGAGCGWGRRAVGSNRRDVNRDAIGAPVRDSSDVI